VLADHRPVGIPITRELQQKRTVVTSMCQVEYSPIPPRNRFARAMTVTLLQSLDSKAKNEPKIASKARKPREFCDHSAITQLVWATVGINGISGHV
jgi:hypothetical protein